MAFTLSLDAMRSKWRQIGTWFVVFYLVSVSLSFHRELSNYINIFGITDDISILDDATIKPAHQEHQQALPESPLHRFAYNRTLFYRNGPPMIVILAGPHKSASSSLQDFFVNLIGKRTSIHATNNSTTTATSSSTKENLEATSSKKELYYYRPQEEPHPLLQNWVWPVEIREEYQTHMGSHFHDMLRRHRKFYAIFASYISRQRTRGWFRGKSKQWEPVAKRYFQELLKHAYDNEKVQGDQTTINNNLLIASETFDSTNRHLVQEKDKKTNDKGTSTTPIAATIPTGEELHVPPESKITIDRLLEVLPSSPSNHTKEDELEVCIHYRTPRINHVISLWHQRPRALTLREFLEDPNSRVESLYQSNPLALALQYVTKGIRVTLVDMTGVSKYYESITKESNAPAVVVPSFGSDTTAVNTTIIEGLHAVVACEVMLLGKTVCDKHHRLYIPNLQGSFNAQVNKKHDPFERQLTTNQLEQIDTVIRTYDCEVWKYLQTYQSMGLFRVLHPQKSLFDDCYRDSNSGNNNNNNNEISFLDTLKKVSEIASEDNGIPRRHSSRQAKALRTKKQGQQLRKEGVGNLKHKRRRRRRKDKANMERMKNNRDSVMV